MRPTKYTTAPLNCDIWKLYYKKSLNYPHSPFTSYFCLTICDHPGVESRATVFTPKPAISPHELSGDIATLRANLSYLFRSSSRWSELLRSLENIIPSGHAAQSRTIAVLAHSTIHLSELRRQATKHTTQWNTPARIHIK